MKRVLLLIKRPPVQPFSVHMPENVVKVLSLYQLQSKEVSTKHTQTSCMPDRWVQHTLHSALNDYSYKHVQQEIRNSDRLLEIFHQFLELWLVIKTCQTFWPVIWKILLSDTVTKKKFWYQASETPWMPMDNTHYTVWCVMLPKWLLYLISWTTFEDEDRQVTPLYSHD